MVEKSQAWWHGAAIYQIYPRSFADANGDGVGDLAGIINKLDYVADLGVDGIWLSPFYSSPMKDFGYDVSDYRDVDPLFGTLSEFKTLLETAHAVGLKVLIDQVWSHSSDKHEWFKESRASKSNKKSDWYVWADAKPDGTPPNNWLSVFGGAAWTWDTRRRQYYLHNFLKEQPDLNFHNPDVQDAVLDIARFWLDLGVDGFRLDVCNFYFHDPSLADNPVRTDIPTGPNPHDWQSHIHCRSRPENLNFLSRLRSLVDHYGDICLMGEIGDDHGLARLIEYTSGRRLHTGYCFDLLSETCDVGFLQATLEQWLNAGDGWPTWALGNHDFPRVATRWTDGNPAIAQLKLFAAFQCCLMGSICIYQGEELGLEQAIIPFERLQDPEGKAFWPDKPGRDGCRTPIPWTSNLPGCGFSEAPKCWLPIPSSHAESAIETQKHDPNSLLSVYRNLLALRRDTPALRHGDLEFLDVASGILAFTRQAGGEQILCLFNFTSMEVTLPADLTSESRSLLNASGVEFSRAGQIHLAPWGFAVLQPGFGV